MMEVTYLQEIETGRRTLLENCSRLDQIADYCEDNYVQAKDKRVALEETKNFTTQSLASVAYQINTLATSMLQMLDCTASKIDNMGSSMNSINLTIDLNDERISRQTIKSSLMTPNDCIRTHKIIKPDVAPSFANKVKYVSVPVDFGSLDDVGHGMKLGLPSSSPRGSRSSSLRSRGSNEGSIRQKGSTSSLRSPVTMISRTPSTNSLQPPVFTEPMHLDESLTSIGSDQIPPPPTPPPPSPPHPQVSEGVLHGSAPSDMGSSMEAVDRAPPPPSPPLPPPTENDDGLSGADLPQPPRPTSLLFPPSQSPHLSSHNPQQQMSSSPMVNGTSNHLHVPGEEQQLSRSPTRKATVTRKPSRSPRPTKRPPPPPSAAGHIVSSDVSNPLYFSAPPAPTAPPAPPAPAPTPTSAPPPPPGGGQAPPPPPPPPPIGGMGAKKPAESSIHQQEHSAPASQKKPPAQATVSFADQLKQRLAKLEAEKVTPNGQTLESRETREEPNNNQTFHSQPPSTTEAIPGLAANSGPAESDMENVVQTEFISQETSELAPPEFLWKGVALFDYDAMREDEMTFQEGDVIYVTQDFKDGWLAGVCNGVRAMVPGNYVGPSSSGTWI